MNKQDEFKEKECTISYHGDLSQLSGVSIEQMQADFERIANAYDCDSTNNINTTEDERQ